MSAVSAGTSVVEHLASLTDGDRPPALGAFIGGRLEEPGEELIDVLEPANGRLLARGHRLRRSGSPPGRRSRRAGLPDLARSADP